MASPKVYMPSTNCVAYTNNQGTSKCRQKILYTFCTISVALLISLNIALLVYVVPKLQAQSLYTEEANSICLPCEGLKKTYLKHYPDRVTEKDGSCCINRRNKDDLDIFLSAKIKQIIHEQLIDPRADTANHSEQVPGGIYTGQRPAAEFYYREGENRTSIWESENGLTFSQGGITVEKRQYIRIPQDGAYEVRCRIIFWLKSNFANTEVSLNLFHKMHDGQPEELRTDFIKIPSSRRNTDIYYKLTVDGIFELHKNDSLYIELSPEANVKSDSKSSYFNLHQL